MLPQTCFGRNGPLFHHSKPGLTLKIADSKSWTYTDGTVI